MKTPGLSLKSVIAVTAAATGIYLLSILADAPVQWIFGLCFLAMVGIVWMAIRILKDSYSTDKTFDEYFYMDREDIRRNGKE